MTREEARSALLDKLASVVEIEDYTEGDAVPRQELNGLTFEIGDKLVNVPVTFHWESAKVCPAPAQQQPRQKGSRMTHRELLVSMPDTEHIGVYAFGGTTDYDVLANNGYLYYFAPGEGEAAMRTEDSPANRGAVRKPEEKS